MLRNYVKIAWRNLLRHRTFSLINLLGLSISIAFCLLLFFHIRYEQSFDEFQAKKGQLFRMESTNIFADPRDKPDKSLFNFLSKGEDEKNSDIFPLVVGPDLQRVFPEILSYTRWKEHGEEFVRVGGEVLRQGGMVYADSNFFHNFSFKVLRGDAAKTLADPKKVILTATTAKKYFGDKDPIGRTIEIASDSNRLLSVAAIVADAPRNSSIQYSMVLPLAADPRYTMDITEKFNHSDHYLALEMKKGTDLAAFGRKLNRWMRGYFFPTVQDYLKFQPDLDLSHYHWSFRPLSDCHYNASDWGHYTDIKSIYQLGCIVFVILLLASLNYVLITVSGAAARSQEVGVRKVMGAARWNVIWQSWTETQLLVGIATIVGVGLAWAGIPLLQHAIDSDLVAADISWTDVFAGALSLALLLGLLAGFYPALLISGLKPASILQSFQTFRIKPRFSRMLVIFQFSCCVLLMMAAFVIDRQMAFINHKDLGFDKDQVLIVRNPVFERTFSLRLRDRVYAFARSQPGISDYCGANGQLNGIGSMNGLMVNGQQYWMRQYAIDYRYIDLLRLKMEKGRDFSPAFPTDTVRGKEAVIVNETLWGLLGKEAKLGFFCTPIHATIIGVVKDYHVADLSKKIEPTELILAKGWIGNYYLKISPGKMAEVMSALKKRWAEMADHYPLEYTFLDAQIAKMYVPEMRWQETVRASCMLAILIACMGLFGLSAISAVNRTREIGIRKVLGAGLKDLLGVLGGGFVKMVLLSILIATPISWWLMNKWLADFAYRIDLRWWMPMLVGAVALAIAVATVSYTVLRVAKANPVDSLRSE
jgi:putative ABC transport system permease protein